MNQEMTIALKNTVSQGTALLLGSLVLYAGEIRAQAAPDEDITELEPMVVQGDLLLTPSDELATGSTLLGEDELRRQGSFHFEDVLGRIPNLTFAGGTARPRFFQIRGIGENSQFGNEIPATSVGFLVDGIDFTGMASAVSLYDAGHVEILRGPQAAAFGASAMAGLVVVQSRAPTPYPTASAEVSFGENNFHRFAIAAGGPVGDRGSPLRFRVSGERLRSDGFIANTFLGREDTNERDESTARLQLRWEATPRLTFDATALVADFNNGYDVWSLEQVPFETTTDEPGRDEQRTRAASLKADLTITDAMDLLYLGSFSDSDLLYSFDWDWSNPEKMRDRFGPVIFGGTERTEHQRSRVSHDLRLRSLRSKQESKLGSWAAGLYYQDFEEEQEYTVDVRDFDDFQDTRVVHSTYATESLAAYGQASYPISSQLTFEAAARLERASIKYRLPADSGTGEEAETLYGGNVSLTWEPLPDQRFYASIDRGYKMGGVNLDEEVPAFAAV
ncbi:MAG: TonB-dependent receptor, partial [Verrucomicrobia bacterium]|nr:TonB-dependent receptor [Verrucomicrobiota bacterium]